MVDVAVVGCGHMGTHHARTVASHPDARLVAAIDIVPERARRLAADFGGEALQAVPEGVDAVVVATPTTTHVDVARPLLERGHWCLVEKPLAFDADAAAVLGSPRVQVGHIERFNPAVRAAGRLRPAYVEARRVAPNSGRSRDIDVVRDLMIHDLDLLLDWCDEVDLLDAVGVAVLGSRIDTASVRLRTADGLVATLVASRVAESAERVVQVYEPGRYTHLDLMAGVATRAGEALPTDGRDALTAQLDAFLLAVRGEQPVVVGGREGLRAVHLAERIVDVIVA